MWREYWRGSGAGSNVMWWSGNCKWIHISWWQGASASARCEAAVTARKRCGWVKFRECGELLYGRRFSLRLKGAVYKSYIKPAILYGSEAWCLKKSEMGILQWSEESMVRAMCGVRHRDRKICRKDVLAGFVGSYGSVGYGKQCTLVWSYVEERGWSCLKKGIRFWGCGSKEEGEAKEDVENAE